MGKAAQNKISPKFEQIVKAHQPAGYSLTIKPLRGETAAYAHFARHIRVGKLEDREDLFIYLHEVGHVALGHLRKTHPAAKVRESTPEHEFAADQYAIAAMREAGIAVPREILKHHKAMVRELVEAAKARGEECEDEGILKYAFGKAWRSQR